MGAFDDLIPTGPAGVSGSGVFDDLIPSADRATPEMPPEPSVPSGFHNEYQSQWAPDRSTPQVTPESQMGGVFDDLVPPMPDTGSPLPQRLSDVLNRQAQYEAKGLLEVTGERLSSGMETVRQSGSMLTALNSLDQVAVLQEAQRLQQSGGSFEDFVRLSQKSSRFPVGVLESPELTQRAMDRFAKRPIPALERTIESQERQAEIPSSPIAGEFMKLLSEQGVTSSDAWSVFMRDPLGIIGQVSTESLPIAAPVIAGGVAAGPMGSGAAGYGIERGISVIQAMQDAGVDMSSPEGMATLLSDPAKRAEFEEFAAKRGVPIAVMDALTMGISSALARKPLTNVLSQTVIEPVGEGVGEAGAQLASTGEIDAGEVVGEVLGGVGPGVAQGISTSLAEVLTSGPNKLKPPRVDTPPSVPINEGVQRNLPRSSGAPDQLDRRAAPIGAPPSEVDTPPQVENTEAAPSASPLSEPVGVEIGDVAAPDLPSPKANEPATPQKRPATYLLKRSGLQVDQNGPLGIELQNAGMTPQNTPGLFSSSGAANLDNITASEHPELSEVLKIGSDGYFDEASIVEALSQEFAGTPQQGSDQIAAQAQYDDFVAATQAMSEGYEGQTDTLALPEPSIAPRDQDISTDGERYEHVSAVTDDAIRELGLSEILTAQERVEIIDTLVAEGGPIERAIEKQIIRSVLNAEAGSPIQTPATAEVPGFEGRVEGSSAGGAQQSSVQPVPDGPSQEGNGALGKARSGTEEGGRVDVTAGGKQLVVPGAEQITDRQRAERKQEAPLVGGDEAPQEGGLFSPRGPELFDDRAEPNTSDTGRGAERGSLQDMAIGGDHSDRAGSQRSKQRSESDTAAIDTSDDGDKPKPKKTKPQPQGSLSPSFMEYSFADKNSVYEAAFRAAGIEPDAARLMDKDNQISILKRVLKAEYGVEVKLPTRTVSRNTITGRKVTQSQQKIGTRDAIDQLLDAYRQMEMLAHMFSVPKHAIGLPQNGTSITLSLDSALPGALGMFSYSSDERVISLPGRSRSFSHEWGHALDQWMSGYLFDRPTDEIQGMLSRDVLRDGMQPGSRSDEVAQAYVQLMQALFTDKVELAAMQIDLARKASEVTKKGKPTPSAKKAARALEDIKTGKKLDKSVTSKYFKDSKAFGEMFDKAGYFTDPAEMLARAMETWAGVKAAQVSDLPTTFLAKSDWAYTTAQDDRSKLTFPKDADAKEIFLAIENLGKQLRNAEAFGTDGAASAPADTDVFNPRDWDKYEERGWLEEELAAFRKDVTAAKKVRIGRSPLQKVGDTLDYFLSTYSGYARGIVRRQPKEAQRALTQLADMFMTEPGSGRNIGQVWEEAVEARAKHTNNRFENIIRKHKMERATPEQLEDLRLTLTVESHKPKDAKVRAAAADLRMLLDAEWRYIKEAGIKVGYTRNGYLPRIVNLDAVMADNEGKFLKQAAKVYKVMFGRDVRQAETIDQISDVRRLIKKLTRATREIDGGVYRVNLLAGHENLIKAWRKAVNPISKANGKLSEAKAGGNKAEIEKAQTALDEAIEKFESAHSGTHGKMLDLVERVFSEESAENWQVRITTGNPMDFDSKGPDQKFLKSRTMPKEADEFMAEFYEGNPLSLIQSYLLMAPRRAEYVRRAGAGSEKVENLLREAARKGADSSDLKEMRNIVNMLTGRSNSPSHASSSWMGGWVYVAMTVTLLKRATFSSLAEPITAGIRTGDPRDVVKALASSMGHIVRTKSAKNRAEVARIIGLVTSAQHETVMLNRYGGDLDPNGLQTKILSSFFNRTLLTPLTNMQRTSMLAVSNHVIRRYLEDVVKSKSKRSIEELAELGISQEAAPDLLDWLNSLDGDAPTPDDLIGPDGDFYNPASEIWAAANGRLINQIIQNPKRFSRPGASLTDKYKLMYGIMGFMYSFHQNIMLPLVKRQIDQRRPGESLARFATRAGYGTAKNVARAAPAMAALFAGQFLAGMLREAIFNADKWEEMEEEGTLDEYLTGPFMAKTLSRTGFLGPADVAYNAAMGLRYQRDLANLYAGPHHGYVLDVLEDFIALGARNTKKTDTAERNAVKAAAGLVTNTGSGLLLSAIPGGPMLGRGYGLGMWAIDAANMEESFAEAMYPK